MSSTNKTTNYNLSQFIGSDKPAWLADYNQDMSKIDTQMKANADSATGADGKADANTTKIGDLANLTTSVKTSLVSAINEVDGNADAAQNTANSASNVAMQAKSKADGIENYLTLSQSANLTYTATKGTIDISASHLSVRRNESGTLGKIYGQVLIRDLENQTGNLVFTTSDTGFRPSEAITFDGCAYLRVENTSYHIFRQVPMQYTLNTDGTITFTYTGITDTYMMQLQFVAVLLFITDFGDVPLPE